MVFASFPDAGCAIQGAKCAMETDTYVYGYYLPTAAVSATKAVGRG